MRKIIAYILGTISMVSLLLASGIKDIQGWEVIARPYFIVWFVALAVAVILYNWNSIRRVTYPARTCLSAWLYDHNIVKTKFGRSTYRVYVYYGKSYSKFYEVVQEAFDRYLAEVKEV
jgi:hypothetical protein